jgi:hypothetical protein
MPAAVALFSETRTAAAAWHRSRRRREWNVVVPVVQRLAAECGVADAQVARDALVDDGEDDVALAVLQPPVHVAGGGAAADAWRA